MMQPLPQPVAAALDSALDSAIAQARIVGAVVLVAKDGHLAYARAAGDADREQRIPMRIDTPFRLASVSKPFTSMAVLKLIQAGRLDADDAVDRWLPEFRPRLRDGREASMTIAQLLSHTAGLDYGFLQVQDGSYARAGVSDGLDHAPWSLRENLRRIASVPLDREPGSGWRYSVATDVLGAVIEAVTGSSLAQAMDQLVLQPLKLQHCGFRTDRDDLAVPYLNGDGVPERMTGPTVLTLPEELGGGPLRFDPQRVRRDDYPSGGGGMWGDARDVLSLLEAFRDGPFLPQALRERAFAAQIGAEAQAQGPGWGFSWFGARLMDASVSPLTPGSVSWGGVYGASWFIDPHRALTVVALTNTTLEGMNGRFTADVTTAACGGTQP